jgi:ribose transport system permease protein
MKLLRRNAWVAGLCGALRADARARQAVQPNYGAAGFESLARAALPYAFATAAQAVVVIAGGIDLSIASMMAVTSVTAAVMMDGASEGQAVLVVIFVLGLGALMGVINGVLIVLTRVPDIVVTLAMLFVWEGVALLILASPGGAAAEWLKGSLIGSVDIPACRPRSTPSCPRRCSSSPSASRWSGCRSSARASASRSMRSGRASCRPSAPACRRALTKIAAYGLAGLFAAWAGCADRQHRHRRADPRALSPRLRRGGGAGGRVLGGGKGGLFGPIVAVFILRLARTILTFMAVDPNVTTIVEGTIMVGVVMFGGFLAIRGRRR